MLWCPSLLLGGKGPGQEPGTLAFPSHGLLLLGHPRLNFGLFVLDRKPYQRQAFIKYRVLHWFCMLTHGQSDHWGRVIGMKMGRKMEVGQGQTFLRTLPMEPKGWRKSALEQRAGTVHVGPL